MLSASSILLKLPAQLIIKEKDLGQRSNSRWPGFASTVVYLIYKVSTMEDDAAASARDLINSQSHGTTIGFNLLRIF